MSITVDVNEVYEAQDGAVPAQVSIDTISDDLSGIVAKVLFLQIRYGNFGNTRKVQGSSVLTTDADVSLLRVSKTLLESPELEAIRKHDSKLRKWLNNTCLPSFDVGIMLLPKAFFLNATEKLKQHLAERILLVDAFVAAYPSLIEKAQKELGSLWSAGDYLSVDQVKAKFIFKWRFVNFGAPESLKEISDEVYLEEKKKAQEQLQTATEEITAVMRETMFEMVNHLKERLTPGADGKPRILKESAVTNLKEFLDSFDLRNVTNDKELTVEVQKARALLNGTTANALRTSEEWRTKILAGMENITGTLGTMVEEKSGRKFRAE